MFLATFMLETLDFQHLGPSIQHVACILQQPWSLLKSKMSALEALQKIEECKLGHIGRVQLGPITTHTREIRLKDFQFRLVTLHTLHPLHPLHEAQFARKEFDCCQFEVLKRLSPEKSGKIKPLKSNPLNPKPKSL